MEVGRHVVREGSMEVRWHVGRRVGREVGRYTGR